MGKTCACPRCGASLTAPSMRGLSSLEPLAIVVVVALGAVAIAYFGLSPELGGARR